MSNKIVITSIFFFNSGVKSSQKVERVQRGEKNEFLENELAKSRKPGEKKKGICHAKVSFKGFHYQIKELESKLICFKGSF